MKLRAPCRCIRIVEYKVGQTDEPAADGRQRVARKMNNAAVGRGSAEDLAEGRYMVRIEFNDVGVLP